MPRPLLPSSATCITSQDYRLQKFGPVQPISSSTICLRGLEQEGVCSPCSRVDGPAPLHDTGDSGSLVLAADEAGHL
ncbi:hypothetical protein O3P69_011634 [Scylla paramamosain]|uniref:Uncharacterized protein n=1 Tax=Scylla paramamosain TaxID=85552 RepID=A0AAW0T6Q7_SCYPA